MYVDSTKSIRRKASLSQTCRGMSTRQSDKESIPQSNKQPPRRDCHPAERPAGPSRPAAAAAASYEPWGLRQAHAGLLPGPCYPPDPSPHPSSGCGPALSGPPQTDVLLPAQAMAAVRRCGMGHRRVGGGVQSGICSTLACALLVLRQHFRISLWSGAGCKRSKLCIKAVGSWQINSKRPGGFE